MRLHPQAQCSWLTSENPWEEQESPSEGATVHAPSFTVGSELLAKHLAGLTGRPNQLEDMKIPGLLLPRPDLTTGRWGSRVSEDAAGGLGIIPPPTPTPQGPKL